MSSITVLGTGAMGSRIAANLTAAGHTVTVWNRTPASAEDVAVRHGVTATASVTDAVAGADVVISMVTDDAAARSVWVDMGGFEALAPGAVAVESSTITPDAARDLARVAGERGVAFLEAPVVGSRPQADAGALLYLVGGEGPVLDRVRDVLDVSAGAIRHTGPVGTGAEMKLAINGLFGIQVAAYGEIVGMLSRTGMDVADACDVLSGLPITSPGLQRILGLVAERSFDPNFPIRLVAKDFGYLVDTAEALGADVPLSTAAADVYRDALGDAGEQDIAAIASRYVTG